MIKGLIQGLKDRKQRKEAERESAQTEEWLRAPYTQLMFAQERQMAYLSNPENLQPVTELQGRLLEANGGLVLGLPPEKEEKPSRLER